MADEAVLTIYLVTAEILCCDLEERCIFETPMPIPRPWPIKRNIDDSSVWLRCVMQKLAAGGWRKGRAWDCFESV